MGEARKERSRVPVGALEEVSPEQGQSAASIEGTNAAVLEQGPQLGRNERDMSRRGRDGSLWHDGGKVRSGRGLSPAAAGVSQWH